MIVSTDYSHVRIASSRRGAWVGEQVRAWLISPEGKDYPCGSEHTYCWRNEELLKIAREIDSERVELDGIVDVLRDEGWSQAGYFVDPPAAYLAGPSAGPVFLKFQELLYSLNVSDNTKVVVANKDILWKDFKFFDSMMDMRKFLWRNRVGSSRHPRYLRVASIEDSEKVKEKYSNKKSWWIGPNGKLWDSGHNHARFIAEHPEIFGEGADEKTAKDMDWIRVGEWGDEFYFDTRYFSGRQLKTAQDLCRSVGRSADVMVYIGPKRGLIRVPEFLAADSQADLAKVMRARFGCRKIGDDDRASSRRQAARLDRACMLSPQGKLIACGWDHNSYVRQHAEEFGVQSDDPDPVETLIGRGWIKIGVLGRAFYFAYKRMTQKLLDKAQSLVLEDAYVKDVQIVDYSWEEGKTHDMSRNEFLQANKPSDLRRMFSIRERTSSLPKSRNFLIGVDIERMDWPLRQAFDLLNLSGKKDKLSANQVASVFQANDEFLQDHIGRTAVELIQDLNAFFQYGPAQEQTV